MSAEEQLRSFYAIYARHKAKVEEEIAHLDAYQALLAKWPGEDPRDVVYREAKRRACAELNQTKGK